MGWYRIEHAVVMALGFLLGVALAMCIAPGDVALMVVAGIVLTIFVRAFLARSYGGDWFWPLPTLGGKKNARASLTTGRH